jgi:hypothetical protein
MSVSRKDQGQQLPPLAASVQADLEQFRQLGPPPLVEARLGHALRRGESRRMRPPPAPRSRFLSSLFTGVSLATLGAFATLMLVLNPRSDVSKNALIQEYSVTLPSEGAVSIPLPWSLHEHPRGAGKVSVETPADQSHSLSAFNPAPSVSNCGNSNCVHEWHAPIHPADGPLNVEIKSPGRYEFHVTHESGEQRSKGLFVVNVAR